MYRNKYLNTLWNVYSFRRQCMNTRTVPCSALAFGGSASIHALSLAVHWCSVAVHLYTHCPLQCIGVRWQCIYTRTVPCSALVFGGSASIHALYQLQCTGVRRQCIYIHALSQLQCTALLFMYKSRMHISRVQWLHIVIYIVTLIIILVQILHYQMNA